MEKFVTKQVLLLIDELARSMGKINIDRIASELLGGDHH